MSDINRIRDYSVFFPIKLNPLELQALGVLGNEFIEHDLSAFAKELLQRYMLSVFNNYVYTCVHNPTCRVAIKVEGDLYRVTLQLEGGGILVEALAAYEYLYFTVESLEHLAGEMGDRSREEMLQFIKEQNAAIKGLRQLPGQRQTYSPQSAPNSTEES